LIQILVLKIYILQNRVDIFGLNGLKKLSIVDYGAIFISFFMPLTWYKPIDVMYFTCVSTQWKNISIASMEVDFWGVKSSGCENSHATEVKFSNIPQKS
jgi:hypothetical protein